MSARRLSASLFAILFLAALVYVSYQTAVVVMRTAALRKYQRTIYAAGKYPPEPKDIKQLAAEISRKADRLGGDDLKSMQFDILSYEAWCYPDEQVDTLHVALPLGEQLYQRMPDNRLFIGDRLVWSYVYTALPGQVEHWMDETAREPSLRSTVLYYVLSARLMRDDLAGARKLIEDELAQSPSAETQTFALVGYTMLNDLDVASRYEQSFQGDTYFPALYSYVLGDYLIEQGRFGDAYIHLSQAMESTTNGVLNADDAATLLVAYAGEHGLNQDPYADQLSERAAQSTHNARGQSSVKAWTLAELYRIRGKSEDWQLLQALVSSGKPRYNIAAAYAAARLYYRDGTASMVPLLSAVELAQRALELAQDGRERQEANLIMARALLLPVSGQPASAEERAISLTHLRCALGDPQADGSVQSQRVPEYSEYLLDENVRAARLADQQFDVGVHAAITEYLARREALYADVVPKAH